jgi:hypothetical protein
LLNKAGEPVPNKVLQFLAWEVMHRAFSPQEFFADLFAHEEVYFLSSGHWCGGDLIGEFNQTLEVFTEQLIEAGAAAPEEGGEPREFHVTDEEIAETAAILQTAGRTASARSSRRSTSFRPASATTMPRLAPYGARWARTSALPGLAASAGAWLERCPG